MQHSSQERHILHSVVLTARLCSFIDVMCSATDRASGGGLSDTQIIQQAYTAMWGGQETSSISLQVGLLLLLRSSAAHAGKLAWQCCCFTCYGR